MSIFSFTAKKNMSIQIELNYFIYCLAITDFFFGIMNLTYQ